MYMCIYIYRERDMYCVVVIVIVIAIITITITITTMIFMTSLAQARACRLLLFRTCVELVSTCALISCLSIVYAFFRINASFRALLRA